MNNKIISMKPTVNESGTLTRRTTPPPKPTAAKKLQQLVKSVIVTGIILAGSYWAYETIFNEEPQPATQIESLEKNIIEQAKDGEITKEEAILQIYDIESADVEDIEIIEKNESVKNTEEAKAKKAQVSTDVDLTDYYGDL